MCNQKNYEQRWKIPVIKTHSVWWDLAKVSVALIKWNCLNSKKGILGPENLWQCSDNIQYQHELANWGLKQSKFQLQLQNFNRRSEAIHFHTCVMLNLRTFCHVKTYKKNAATRSLGINHRSFVCHDTNVIHLVYEKC